MDLATNFQVDDSPRYAGIGEWQHMRGLSTFKHTSSNDHFREEEHKNDDILYGEDTILLCKWLAS